MKILEVYANSFVTEGGVETHLKDLCKCLKAKGDSVTILSYSEQGPRTEIISGIRIFRIKIPSIILLLRYPSFIILGFMITYYCRKMRIDVVHIHGYTAAMAGALTKNLLHKPVVATFHLGPQYTNRPLVFFEPFEKRARCVLMSTLDGFFAYQFLQPRSV